MATTKVTPAKKVSVAPKEYYCVVFKRTKNFSYGDHNIVEKNQVFNICRDYWEDERAYGESVSDEQTAIVEYAKKNLNFYKLQPITPNFVEVEKTIKQLSMEI